MRQTPVLGPLLIGLASVLAPATALANDGFRVVQFNGLGFAIIEIDGTDFFCLADEESEQMTLRDCLPFVLAPDEYISSPIGQTR